MSSPWSEDRDAAQTRRQVERARASLLTDDPDAGPLDDIRSLIRDSWRRSMAGSVRAEGLPPIDLTGDELDEYLRGHPLASTLDLICGLLLPGGSRDSGIVVAVGDAAGRLLWIEGDSEIRNRTGDMGFIPGANWSEGAVGTSAPGTAIELGRSVQIHGAEHFNLRVAPWSCTAAPVRDPETRRVIGVIDITGGTQAITPQAQLLVDATARAVESELLISRLRAREATAQHRPPRRRRVNQATLQVLGRQRAALELQGDDGASVIEFGRRHAEILLLLRLNPAGLSAERLAELVYGEGGDPATLRPEIVRLRKALRRATSDIDLASRPYRLVGTMTTDAHGVLGLLDRGAHRVALAAYRGDVLPESEAPGVTEFRDTVRATLREALMAEASPEVLLAFADTQAGADDRDLLMLILEQLPAKSPKRAGVLARVERLDAT
ncbi:transcriptional regulator [Tessaracoccus aquimaris]|uniref:Transcriptional regulator n=1 Tax=Tessaracoccus aquimaris TaxID=1332264 RepID=A0A1Q2CQ56_9ACTN|nr:GAF domain-containing protein [Tessaracoccus aquimaris]AQP48257.1 transcriptional regulator [Tessaracoccus aquimaris]